jgi:hypothetical protein
VFAEHGRVRDRLGNFESGGKERAPELIKWSQQIDALIKSKGLDPNVAAPFANLALEDARKILYGQQRTVAAAVPLEEFWDVDLNVVPPPGASYPLDAPCPVAGPAVNRCKLITEYREAVQALVKAAPGQTIADTAPVIAAFDNQRNQLLFAQSAVNARYRAMDSLLRSLDARIQESFSLLTTTGGSATTRKAWYISMDTGIAVAPALNEVFPYFGSTMFFRPVNKAVPPSTFGTRFSVEPPC